MENHRIIAAFDFDGTLITKDSFIEYAKHSVGKWRLLTGCIFVAPWLMLWKLRLCSGGYAKERLFRKLYKGMSKDRFKKFCNTFALQISQMENFEIVERLKWHQQQGHTVYIVSASAPDWIAPWAAAYGIGRNRILGTDIEVDASGRITGRFLSPNCMGEEKVNRLRMTENGLDTVTLYAYGDSSGDVPLLEIADYPTYVGKQKHQ